MWLVNHTFLELSWQSWQLNGGASWLIEPPDFIGMGQQGCFAAEGTGIFAGARGAVVYSTSAGDVVLYFDNPYWPWEPHVYQCQPPAGY
jgi:hypothetical protein